MTIVNRGRNTATSTYQITTSCNVIGGKILAVFYYEHTTSINTDVYRQDQGSLSMTQYYSYFNPNQDWGVKMYYLDFPTAGAGTFHVEVDGASPSYLDLSVFEVSGLYYGPRRDSDSGIISGTSATADYASGKQYDLFFGWAAIGESLAMTLSGADRDEYVKSSGGFSFHQGSKISDDGDETFVWSWSGTKTVAYNMDVWVRQLALNTYHLIGRILAVATSQMSADYAYSTRKQAEYDGSVTHIVVKASGGTGSFFVDVALYNASTGVRIGKGSASVSGANAYAVELDSPAPVEAGTWYRMVVNPDTGALVDRITTGSFNVEYVTGKDPNAGDPPASYSTWSWASSSFGDIGMYAVGTIGGQSAINMLPVSGL